ncbi:MAG: Asp-tRNA(Asn)/Glu-tRNA(Gln) amidotransferase subunit GatB [Alphaproteobacteria bacterium]|nr:Asp-tRNA(Asn)/Glu-tRNA(Gln) amidotransferase subunit GatB [Alphaproteobacteria bacterium]
MSEIRNYLLVKGKTGLWEVIIGLEVHAQITSKSKLFSSASTDFGNEPNTQVSFIDAGFPGMLPVINEYCVEQAIKTGLGLNAEIHPVSVFDRKNYFYADLPTGYQISQFKHPIVGEGFLEIELIDGTTKNVAIERLHLEQDAGKSIHDQNPTKSYIDLNRAGVALMEIVTKPDMRSREEAMAFMRKLRSLLRYLGTCDGNMEQGSMRADVNISVRRPAEALGTRAEIKNVNSIRFLGQAVDYEVTRQIEILEEGGEILQETRLFDPVRGETRSMRSKEDAHDYRYFPDPDLPPLHLDPAMIEHLKQTLPELPEAKKKRFIKSFELSPYDAAILVSEREIADYFETTLEAGSFEDLPKRGKLIANWMTGDLFAALNRDNLSIAESKVSASALTGMVNLIIDGTISGRIAKDVFIEMWETGQEAIVIVQQKGLEQVSDNRAIDDCINQIMSANPQMVEDYRSGKDKLFGFFVGQVMKAMAGKANPSLVNEILIQKLKG